MPRTRQPKSGQQPKKEAKARAESQRESEKWRTAWKNVLKRHSTHWTPHVVFTLITILVSPAVGLIMESKKYTVYGAALGLTISIWVVAILFAKELDKPVSSTKEKASGPVGASRTGPRLREGLSQISLSLGGVTATMPVPQDPFPRRPFQIAGFAPALYVDPGTGDLFIDVSIADVGGGEPMIEIKNNQFAVNRPDWDRNFNDGALEVVNSRSQPVFQLIYRTPNHVVLNGVFPIPGGFIVADDTGMEIMKTPPAKLVVKRLFRYPSWKYPGQLE